MAGWLDRLLPPAGKSARAGRNLPTVSRGDLPPAARPPLPPEQLPNASLIYGCAAGVLLAVALYFLFTGKWFTAALVLLPAGCFVGFALYFLRHQD